MVFCMKIFRPEETASAAWPDFDEFEETGEDYELSLAELAADAEYQAKLGQALKRACDCTDEPSSKLRERVLARIRKEAARQPGH